MVTLLMLICLISPFGQSPQKVAPNEIGVNLFQEPYTQIQDIQPVIKNKIVPRIGFKPLQERYTQIQDIHPVIKNSGNHSIFLSSRYSKARLRRLNEATGELEDCGGWAATCGTAMLNDPPVEIKPGEELSVEVSGAVPQDGQPCFHKLSGYISGLRTGTDTSRNSQKLPELASTTSKKWKYKLVIGFYKKSWEMGTMPWDAIIVESDWFQFGDE
ncbi:MAG TPA: hypothetical protein PLB18_17925 [Acidobacteriota bacterium]|nr:hypothetical protein [Acidobacteriota bacterium]